MAPPIASVYQVIKKWLSYREKELLGRSLPVDEARYATEMARRITAILLLGPTKALHSCTGVGAVSC